MTKAPKPPSEELDKFLLRLPEGLRASLKTVADENNRSMNAEIVSRLEFSLRMHPHAYIIRALLDLQGELLAHHSVTLSDEISEMLTERAERAGFSPSEFLNMLLRSALHEMDNKTEIGLKIAEHLDKALTSSTEEEVEK